MKKRNYKKETYSKNKHCPGCGKLITNYSNKCSSCSLIGHRHSEETINKQSLSKMGDKNPMYGLRGIDSPIYGKKHSKETREKQSKIRIKLFKERKIIPSNKGRKFSEEWKKNISKTKKKLYQEGKIIPFNKGKKCPWTSKRNLIDNPMKNPEIRKKATESLKKSYRERTIKTWNKGLTKETDMRIKIASGKTQNSRRKAFKEGKWCGWNKDKTFREDSRIFNRGGKSFEPYTFDFNKRFKKKIKERDKCCMLCNIGFEDLKELKRDICIHHINYDKLNSIPQNCITLCIKCHGLTGTHRHNWITFFQSLLKERYNYQYTQNQKIILDFLEEDKK